MPRAAELMGAKLGWSKKERAAQESEANKYLGEFGGPVPDKFGASLRAAAKADLRALFKELDADGSGYLDQAEIGQAAEKLGFPFKTKADLQAEFKKLDANGDGKISEREFINWWNAQDGKSPNPHPSPSPSPSPRPSPSPNPTLPPPPQQDGKSGLWQKLHGELNAAGDWEG